MVDQKVKTFLDHVTPEDYHAVQDAAKEYVNTLKDTDVQSEIRAAADTAVLSGDGSAAWRLKDIVNKAQSQDSYVKHRVVLLIMNEPRILRHFSPQFADSVVTRLNGNGHANGHH